METIRAFPHRMAKFKCGLSQTRIDLVNALSAVDSNGVLTGDSKDLPLLSDVVNASYTMIESALSVRKGLDYITALDGDLKSLKISSAEWDMIDEIFEFLKPFAEATKRVEGIKYPTLSCVIPLYNKLLNFVEDWKLNVHKHKETRKGAEAAFEILHRNYDKTTPIYMVATILDPRHKMNYFTHNGWDVGEDGSNLIETKVKPA